MNFPNFIDLNLCNTITFGLDWMDYLKKKSLYINQKINIETIQGGFKNKFELGMFGYNSKA